MQLRPRPSERSSCVYCRDPLSVVPFTCTGCRATYHRDCFRDELRGRCATIGCASAHTGVEAEEQAGRTCLACFELADEDVDRVCTGCASLYHQACWVERIGACCISRRCRPHIGALDLGQDGSIYGTLAAAGMVLGGVGTGSWNLALVGLLLGGLVAVLTLLRRLTTSNP